MSELTPDQKDYALVHVRRAETLLELAFKISSLPSARTDAIRELRQALTILQGDPSNEAIAAAADPYADKTLRPGLNKPIEESA